MLKTYTQYLPDNRGKIVTTFEGKFLDPDGYVFEGKIVSVRVLTTNKFYPVLGDPEGTPPRESAYAKYVSHGCTEHDMQFGTCRNCGHTDYGWGQSG